MGGRGGGPPLTGLDRHPWAMDEARWTYRMVGLKGTARRRCRPSAAPRAWRRRDRCLCAQRITPDLRTRVQEQLLAAADRGARVLILEPSREPSPLVGRRRLAGVEGRGTGGRMAIRARLPPLLQTLDKAAGLDHRELTVRSIWLPGRPREAALRQVVLC